MKNALITTIILFGMLLCANAQDAKLGLTVGLLSSKADIDVSVVGIDLLNINTVKETGFYIGVVGDFEVSEKFHLQPELTYGSAGDLAFLFLPVMAKLFVSEQFHLQAGPQFSYSSNLNDIKQAIQSIDGVLGTNSNIDDVVNTFGADLGFGLGYDIFDGFTIQARYSIPLTDWYSGPLGDSLDVQSNFLNIGIVYFL